MNNINHFAPEMVQDLLLNNNFDKRTLSSLLDIALHQLNEILYGKKLLEKESLLISRIVELKNKYR